MTSAPLAEQPLSIAPLGDRALVIQLGDRIDAGVFQRVRATLQRLDSAHPAIVELVAGFASVTVYYDPALAGGSRDGAPHAALSRALEERLANLAEVPTLDARIVEIPVCYSSDLAPDLATIGAGAGLSAAQVIALHTGASYTVQMIGFTPGFPYLAGLDPRLATPRRSEPRTRVPAGSVGIGGEQAGIYPMATPGGWNIIGRTPLAIFDPARVPAALLRVGDEVRFVAISRARFDAMAGA